MTPITIEDYKMGRDKLYPTEWTPDKEANARELLSRINALMMDLKWEGVFKVSSGWRPAAINAQIKNAAKASAHQTGQACDLIDVNQSLSKILLEKKELLTKYDLYMESPTSTPSWVHLQSRKTKSGNRIFLP